MGISVTLPCAGKGKRLQLDFPKELFPIAKDLTIIDGILRELVDSQLIDRVIIIINHERGQLIDHLSKYRNEFEIIYIYQKDNNLYKDYLKALYDAKEYMLDLNILLFPDTIIPNLSKYITNAFRTMNKDYYKILMFIVKEDNIDILKDEGVLNIENSEILEIDDKPGCIKAKKFNCYWVAYIFHSSDIIEILNFMNNLFCNQKPKAFDLSPSVYIEVQEAYDLGEWDRLYKFFKSLIL